MGSVLVIGYGNASRRDDGVALAIIRALRRRLGYDAAQCDEDETETPEGLATLCVHQLAPELAESLAEREAVVFMDAHVEGAGWDPVQWSEITPAFSSGMVSHHLKPQAVLALCQQIYGRHPRAHVLSVLGTDFDFGEALSPETAARADEALQRLVAFLRSEGHAVPADAKER